MDVDVFKQRFLPFHPKLYRIAYALLDNKADAEDILQDAYCKLWNKRDELGDIQNPEAFSITLVKNLCLDFLRSPKASRRDNEEALETVLLTTDSSPEKELEEKIPGVTVLVTGWGTPGLSEAVLQKADALKIVACVVLRIVPMRTLNRLQGLAPLIQEHYFPGHAN